MALDTYNPSTKQFGANGLALTDTDLNAALTDVRSEPIQLSRLAAGGAQVGQALAWTGAAWSPATIASGGGTTVNLGSATPLVDGFPSAGSSANAAREDHVHPTDNSRYAASNPSQFQNASQVNAAVTAALAGISGGGTPSSAVPLADTPGGSAGTANAYARGDHSHPYDVTRAPLSSPSFTGTVTLSDAGAGLIIGSPTQFGTPHVYFRSEGFAGNAFDASIEVTGGFVGANGQGTINLKSAALQWNGAPIGASSSPTPKIVTNSPYQVLPTDVYLVVRLTTPGACTINLEPAPAANRGLLWVKDGRGDAAINNITIASSGPTVDGGGSITINQNRGAETILYDGSAYEIV